MKPLEGVTVVELSSYFAVPACGRVLATQGARVIKVEPPKGDVQRFFATPFGVPCSNEENMLFDTINGGKDFVSLDLRDPEDMQRFHQLLGQADVFLTNNRTKALAKMGLDYDSLKGRYPRLVCATFSGYGDKGAMKDAPGFDLVALFAETGFSKGMMVETEKSYPMGAAYGFGDIACGTMLAGAIGTALYRRAKTGEGDYVTSSLYGTGVWLTSILSALNVNGYEYPRTRQTCPPNSSPYRTRDGEWVSITINEYDRYWGPLCTALGVPGLIDDERYNTKMAIHDPQNKIEALDHLERAFAQFDADDIVQRLRAADIVVTKLADFKDNHENPQALENRFMAPITYPNGKQTTLAQPPIRFNGMEEPEAAQGKPVGADNAKVFQEFGIE